MGFLRALNRLVPTQELSPKLQRAIQTLQQGGVVYLYDGDGREEETDLVVASQYVTPRHLERLRREAGGLICATLHPRHHEALGLPYLIDILQEAAADHPLLARLTDAVVPYEGRGSKPSFGLTINHRETFTGITDHDRALTISSLARLLGGPQAPDLPARFARQFKTPGHVHLLNAHPRLLDARRGHTELATVLVEMAGLTPSATLCEMLGGPQGTALPKAQAQQAAQRAGDPFLDGADILEAWHSQA